MNIVLVGMPGCGKSTLGVILAKTIGYEFVDTDIIVQRDARKRLQDIINNEGIRSFLKREEGSLLGIVCDRSVIATGGSAVLSEAAMEHLSENGAVVYIKLSPGEIKRRITNIKTRGIACEKNETIESIFEKRSPLYEKYADITVDYEGITSEAAIEEILSAIEAFGKKNGIALP